MPEPTQLDRIEAGQMHIVALLRQLLQAIAEDEPEHPTHDLDGKPTPPQQGESRSL